jgi:short-subunit dehydrogenase
MQLKDKVIVITGASSGIGKEVSKMAAAKGARLAMLSRRLPELEALVTEFKAKNIEAIAIKTDVTSREDIKRAVAEILKKFGHIDVVLNNAGIGHYGAIESLNMEEFDHMMRTNIYGPLYMIQETLPFLKQTKGTIVNISSGLSKRGLPYLSAYGSTKAMFNMISDGLRMELMSTGVKVVVYNPPATDTPFIKDRRNMMKLERVEVVAAGIIKAMEKGTREVSHSGFLAFMNFFAPKALDNMFYKAMVKRAEAAKKE